MSRTDHHRPYWVRCNDPSEPMRYVNHHHENGVCDLAPMLPWRFRRHERCYWAVDVRPYSHAPSWFVNHRWSGPERVRERDELRGLAQTYNAGYDLDDADFANHQHRHGANWDWA